MKKVLVLFLISAMFTAYAEIENRYEFIKVAAIPFGSQEGEIRYTLNPPPGWLSGPWCFTIAADGLIYVADAENLRINVYDMNFKYLKFIIDNKDWTMSEISKLSIDKNNDIIYYTYASKSGLYKIDQKGNKIFHIIPKLLKGGIEHGREFYFLDDYILYYNYDAVSPIELIDNKGEIITGEKALQIVSAIQNKALSRSTNKALPPVVSSLQFEFQNKKNRVIYEGKVLSMNFNYCREYNGNIKKALTVESSRGNTISLGNIEDKKFASTFEIIDFIGNDNANNGYWICFSVKDWGIVVLNQYGTILDLFNMGEYKFVSRSGLAPNGDIYFMDFNKSDKTVDFYKIARQW